ncbi:TIGR04255 family protein [Siccibacter turicensis]|uniref:TIGR04255 family protein n=1 Tax=Siccibacter turicensis TaxID=357233 RepID=UPI00102272FB|nr:TIGR04255 family protein [Siccibacter turicensis]
MAEHLIHMLSKIEFGRISRKKFLDSVDYVIESLRKDFPYVLQVREQNSYRFELKIEGTPEVITETDPILTLLSANKTWGIRISQGFIVLQTKKYEGFTDFINKMSNVIDAVHQHLEITHTSFIGMRYINKFPYIPGEEFKDCFKRLEFLQPDMNEWKKAGSNLNARYVVETEALSLNSGVMVNAPKHNADLAELVSDIDDVTEIIGGPIAHLDIDSFFNNGELIEYNKEYIINKINTLRLNANKVFMETVSSKISKDLTKK